MKLRNIGLTLGSLALTALLAMPLVIGQDNPIIEIEIGKKLTPQQLLRDAQVQSCPHPRWHR